MIDEGRGPEFQAIRGGSALTTGIDDTTRAAFEESYIAKHAAAELDEKAMLDDVYQAYRAGDRAAVKFARELTDPGRIASIEREAAASDEAGAAFTQSLQSPQ